MLSLMKQTHTHTHASNLSFTFRVTFNEPFRRHRDVHLSKAQEVTVIKTTKYLQNTANFATKRPLLRVIYDPCDYGIKNPI